VGWDARVPIQRIPLDECKESAVSKQKIDAPRVDRPATNAGGLGANVNPLGGNKGIQAVKLLKFHVEIPANEAGDPPGGLSVDERIPAQSAGVQEAVGGPVGIAVHVVQPEGIPTT
jgi:hypothetical protein